MARLSIEQVEMRYPSSSTERPPYFSIKGDRETKQVRFLYNTINDIYFDIVHEVTVNNKTQTIQCLNSDGSNHAGCPLCSNGYDQIVKLYIPVLDLSDNKVKIWTRGKSFVAQLQGLAARNNPISGAVIEVMRLGAPRDSKTQYVLQPIAMNDGRTVEQLGVQIPDSSCMMRVMDYNQMNNYALTLNGNVGSAMPAYSQPAPSVPNYPQPNPNMYNPVPNTATPQAPQYSQYSSNPAPAIQPQPTYVPNIGSEPVRRTPASAQSVPTYTTQSDMNTVPMQGAPTMPTPSAGGYIDDDLPF